MPVSHIAPRWVRLVYFKPSGKLYHETVYGTWHTYMWEICEEIRAMNTHPDLTCHWNGPIFVEPTVNDWGYPVLIPDRTEPTEQM